MNCTDMAGACAISAVSTRTPQQYRRTCRCTSVALRCFLNFAGLVVGGGFAAGASLRVRERPWLVIVRKLNCMLICSLMGMSIVPGSGDVERPGSARSKHRAPSERYTVRSCTGTSLCQRSPSPCSLALLSGTRQVCIAQPVQAGSRAQSQRQ
ncbi:uncharacterized protein C8Q71DRAFT_438727 [Rhodofomes roseus]|uniref:Uncharacterized protein n=1 Tax=Rhodofomes roseus TaxID=34475 RepID=A0ABQ8KRS1_9APHY|nr:uncharacterized protein C8Q71DRAFT_438727 [Rhodofomes roseus]KAH9841082.1 hypothetical protein C8Q71DRAFT_438727 [Rhodofomes roseus]